MKSMVIAIGDLGEELRQHMELETLFNIIGNVDTRNNEHHIAARIDDACKHIPASLPESLREPLKNVLYQIVNLVDTCRERDKKVIHFHCIDLVYEKDDWDSVVIGYYEKPVVTKELLLEKIQLINPLNPAQEVRRDLEQLREFIEKYWGQ